MLRILALFLMTRFDHKDNALLALNLMYYGNVEKPSPENQECLELEGVRK
jgi:hypothetical protein